jgi:hypothetical protein
VRTAYQWGGFAGLLLLATTLHGRAGDQIRVYTVPKEHPASPPAQAQPASGAADIPVNSAPVRWTLPAGWEEKPAAGIRLGSFAVHGGNGGNAEVAITSFPGLVGSELDNVNRWRNELALPPVGADDVASEPVTVDSVQGKLFDITGVAARTVVAMLLRNGSSWFIKLRGDTAAVAAAKPVFLEFLKSVRFGGAGVEAPLVEGASKGNVPAQWVETAPSSPMILKSFSVVGDAGAKADITVSSLLGEGGGVLANLNRWRGQLGQPPAEESQLDGMTEPLATQDGKATLVDIVGTDAKTGQPARLIAAIVPRGDKTWFYKLMGDSNVVEGQKNSFVEFVKTVQYP